jgi:hypothetical protein
MRATNPASNFTPRPGAIANWPAFEDSPGALQYLKKYFKLVILSNVDNFSFQASNQKLQVQFDAIYTAEDIGSYKPAARNFDYMLEKLAPRSAGRGSLGMTPDHQQYPTDLRQQCQQDQPQHCEVIAGWLQQAAAYPGRDPDRGLGLWIGSVFDCAHRRIDGLPAFVDGGFPFPAEFSDTTDAFPIARSHRIGKGDLGCRDSRRRA